MVDGQVRTFGQVRHVPGINKNVISLSTLDAKGYRYIGGGGVLKVSKGTRVVLREQRKSRLYVLEGSAITEEAAAAHGLVSDNSGRVVGDRVVRDDSDKASSSSSRAGCDLVDHVVQGDLSRFDNSGGVGVACGGSSIFINSAGVGSERDDLSKDGAQGSSAGLQGLDVVHNC